MRGHVAIPVLIALVACRVEPPPVPASTPLGQGQQYVNAASFRRAMLESSLVNPSNGYSQLRLAYYQEGGWGALPEWNPPVAPVTAATVTSPPAQLQALDVDSVPWETNALVELGRQAFSKYPVQIQSTLHFAIASPEPYGLWQSPGSIGGVVWTQVPNNRPMLAMTCSTCHTSADSSGALADGRPNARFDMSLMLTGGVSSDWGPGRVKVTSDSANDPIAIPDLRPTSSERYLHHDATVRNGLIELAIRIETLIITSNDDAVRPPRKLAFALAMYLWQLQPIAIRAADDSSARGELVFADNCAGCHVPSQYSGDRVALSVVGTDPSVGNSPERTTGSYRVPSLRGVGDRGILFAAGEIPNIDVMLDPNRAIPGHRYGSMISDQQRADLIAFLQTLQ